ncbi:MAG TPA: cob(I)yrinic acid a,c-diamide adenosyltransferase [Chloroflexaceae bacterium]|nr:cob(I)yrinic acid a,c-diamide adenosyltransferase [Chloroflexaceae bacterium]
MGIYTRGGDRGQTSLLGGARVPKDSLRIEVYGTLDEATSALGLARATTRHDDLCREIIELQGELIGVMAELASPAEGDDPGKPFAVPRVQPGQVEALERRIDRHETERLPSNQFVRPGGSPAAAAIDMARTFVRRAERRLIGLAREEELNEELVRYLNRLSDLLYVMARVDEQREVELAVRRQLGAGDGPPALTGGTSGTLTLADCDRMVEAGMRRAAAIGVPMVLAVVDGGGQLLETRRMDGALVVSIGLAPGKAHTAAVVRMATHELSRLARPDGPLYGIEAGQPGLTLVGGGLPLRIGEVVVGAVGVSGGSVEQDLAVAEAMAAAL